MINCKYPLPLLKIIFIGIATRDQAADAQQISLVLHAKL